MFYARAGYFSRAAAMWDQAWELTRDSNELPIRAIADFTLGASITQMATFGAGIAARAAGELSENTRQG